jgi:hypothetical protein
MGKVTQPGFGRHHIQACSATPVPLHAHNQITQQGLIAAIKREHFKFRLHFFKQRYYVLYSSSNFKNAHSIIQTLIVELT